MGTVVAGAQTELAIRIVSPGPERAIGFNGERMTIASNRHAHRPELGGNRQGQVSSVAKLAVAIGTPGPERAVRLHRQAGTGARGNGLPRGGRSHLGGNVAMDRTLIAPLPQLTIGIGSPGPERAIGLHGH